MFSIGIIMIEQSIPFLKLPQEQLHDITRTLLSIPKAHKLIHPCQDRTKYTNILDWMVASLSALKPSPQLLTHQQQIVFSALTEVIDLTKKECLQKGLILQMVQQYFMGLLEGSWKQYEHRKQQISYEYGHNVLQIEKNYLGELKRLTEENEAMKKDKDHRWRNMFMLINDNRIHRKKNKKLIKCIEQELEKSKNITQELLVTQLENEKLKMRIAELEGMEPQLLEYMECSLRLNELQKKVREYPRRAKRTLKSDLVKIEISQSKNLKDKIDFIVNAIEQTGEIVDDSYDQDVPFTHLQFNISTQTQLSTEDKAVNTLILKTTDSSTNTKVHQHVQLDIIDTVLVKVHPKKEKREVGFRQSRAGMFATTNNLGRSGFMRKEDSRSRYTSKKIDLKTSNFSICQSLIITITQCRISYISTYNTQIFNGAQIIRQIQNQVTAERTERQEYELREKKSGRIRVIDVHVQTEQHSLEPVKSPFINLGVRGTVKSFSKLNSPRSDEWRKEPSTKYLQISQEAYFCFDPEEYKRKQKAVKSVNVQKVIRSSMVKKISKEKLYENRRNTQQESKEVKFSLIKESVRQLTQAPKSKKTDGKDNFEQSKTITETKASKNDIRTSKDSSIVDNASQMLRPELTTLDKVQYASEDVSALMTPVEYMQDSSYQLTKPFSTLQNLSNHITSVNSTKPKHKRNQSSILTQSPLDSQNIKKMHSNRLSKLKFPQGKPKRFVTENNQPANLQNLASDNFLRPIETIKNKTKPLHRISEDLTEYDKLFDPYSQNKDKEKSVKMTMGAIKEVEVQSRSADFGKMVEKILKNIEVRLQEAVKNTYTFKVYLTSFFKCFYGKQLFPNFLTFVSKSTDDRDQVMLAFSRLLNPKIPERYAADLFKTFGASVSRCYQMGECPLRSRNSHEVLRYMVSQYYEEQEAVLFEMRMTKQLCFSLLGWFNCLQSQIRKKVVNSELYTFLCDILPQTEDSLDYQWIQDLTFYASNDTLAYQYQIKAKLHLNSNTPLHRLCLFCLKAKWDRMLNIDTSVTQEYNKRIGTFNAEKSIKIIQDNMSQLNRFQHLQNSLKHWFALKEKYGCEINRTLLMLAQLNLLELRLKEELALSKDLMVISWSFQGLRKKSYYNKIKGSV